MSKISINFETLLSWVHVIPENLTFSRDSSYSFPVTMFKNLMVTWHKMYDEMIDVVTVFSNIDYKTDDLLDPVKIAY